MQFTGTSGGVAQPARWQYGLPMGTYDVTVSVGDSAAPAGHSHRLTVEGVVAVNNFVPTASDKFRTATVRASVVGRLPHPRRRRRHQHQDQLRRDHRRRQHAADDHQRRSRRQRHRRPPRHVDQPEPEPRGRADHGEREHGEAARRRRPGRRELQLGCGRRRHDLHAHRTQLAPNTTYTIQTTTGLQDTAGNPFAAFSSTFTTGTSSTPPAPVNFDRTVQADLTGPTSIVIGPDGKLYVGNGVGEIRRYTINANGTLGGSPQVFTPFGAVHPHHHRPRLRARLHVDQPAALGVPRRPRQPGHGQLHRQGHARLGRQPPDGPGQDHGPAPVRPRTT